MRHTIPWSLWAVLVAYCIAAVGVGLIVVGAFQSGWDSLAYLAWGTGVGTAGLAGAFLCAIICAVTRADWRTQALIAAGVAVLLFGGLMLFAANA